MPDTGGGFASGIERWRTQRQTAAITALTQRETAAAGYFAAQAKTATAYIERERAYACIADLPQILAADQYRRIVEREEQVLEIMHLRQLSYERRMTEVADAQTKRLKAQNYRDYTAVTGHTNLMIGVAKKEQRLADTNVDIAVSNAELANASGVAAQQVDDPVAALVRQEQDCAARGDHEGAMRWRQARLLVDQK